ncbi:DNA polymerase IV [Patescibacteria group bacterium]|nr:DNA polymerase IV [Patescibacteria group bacterium]
MKKINNKKNIFVHIDADAFFASVEQVLHRELKGKAIVVGQNGGIVSALSYPAKDLGVSRVLPILTVRKKYPSVHIVASDFHAYGIFSQRMDNIIRNHFPNLVKNSVDEGSIEISKWIDTFDEAKELIKKLQRELYQKLGCTFSFGIARTPLLAKLASGMNKPHGITILNDQNVEEKIYHKPVNCLSGIGKQGYIKLQKNRINTIGDFAKADANWLRYTFSISMPALQKQVLGEVVDIPKQKEDIKSMSRDRSFLATDSYGYLYSQMSMNIEHLAQRMRKENLFTKRIGLRLRNQNLDHTQSFVTLSSQTRDIEYLLSEAKKLLDELYQEGVLYRQVSITCAGLGGAPMQNDLFGELNSSESRDNLFYIIDDLENKFGKSCVGLASSLQAKDNLEKIHLKCVEGDTYPHQLLPGEEIKKRLLYPFLGEIN